MVCVITQKKYAPQYNSILRRLQQKAGAFLSPADPSEAGLFYALAPEEDVKLGCFVSYEQRTDAVKENVTALMLRIRSANLYVVEKILP